MNEQRLNLFTCRFATEPFSTSLKDINNMFVHLTNYSINKESKLFEQNIDPHNPQVKHSFAANNEIIGISNSGLKMDIKQPLEVPVCEFWN